MNIDVASTPPKHRILRRFWGIHFGSLHKSHVMHCLSRKLQLGMPSFGVQSRRRHHIQRFSFAPSWHTIHVMRPRPFHTNTLSELLCVITQRVCTDLGPMCFLTGSSKQCPKTHPRSIFPTINWTVSRCPLGGLTVSRKTCLETPHASISGSWMPCHLTVAHVAHSDYTP